MKDADGMHEAYSDVGRAFSAQDFEDTEAEIAPAPKLGFSAKNELQFRSGNGGEDTDWRLRPHQAVRQEVFNLIYFLLAQHAKKKCVEQNNLKEMAVLHHKARRFDEILYRNASSLEEYADKQTLEQRLTKAAVAICDRYYRKKIEGANE